MIIFSIIFIFVCIPIGVVWSGFALSKMWLWFIVPTFGIPELSIPAAIGLSSIISYITYQRIPDNENENEIEKLIHGSLILFLKPAFALGFGWIVLQFM